MFKRTGKNKTKNFWMVVLYTLTNAMVIDHWFYYTVFFFIYKWSFQKYFPVPYSEMAFWLRRPVSKRKRKNSQWNKNNLCNCNYFIIFYFILDSLIINTFYVVISLTRITTNHCRNLNHDQKKHSIFIMLLAPRRAYWRAKWLGI